MDLNYRPAGPSAPTPGILAALTLKAVTVPRTGQLRHQQRLPHHDLAVPAPRDGRPADEHVVQARLPHDRRHARRSDLHFRRAGAGFVLTVLQIKSNQVLANFTELDQLYHFWKGHTVNTETT